MKKVIFMISCFAFGVIGAQNVDLVKTTKVDVVKDTIDGKIIERSVKTITIKEQPVKFDPADKGKLNQDRVFPATKVTKTFYIDNDNDPFYEKINTVKYYQKNGRKYSFKSSDDGFSISSIDSKNREEASGNASKSLASPYYIITASDFDGVGYFDDNNNFVIEYYDEKERKLKVIEFVED